jgi:uncharacterized protein YndB with AHSA1/START domain
MRRILGIGAVVVGVVVLVGLGVGYLLPVEHTATGSRDIPGPPHEVWAVLSLVQGYPDWRPDVDAVEILARGQRGPSRWRETGANGVITYRLEASEPPGRRVVRIDDPDLPFGGRWIYALEPTAGGTRVTITEEGEVRNPVFRLISRFVIGHDATINAFLAALAGRWEG